MTRADAQKTMEKLTDYFNRIDKLKDEVSKLEFDSRWDGLKYAEDLWKIEKKLDKVIEKMAIDMTVAQIRIERRFNEN